MALLTSEMTTMGWRRQRSTLPVDRAEGVGDLRDRDEGRYGPVGFGTLGNGASGCSAWVESAEREQQLVGLDHTGQRHGQPLGPAAAGGARRDLPACRLNRFVGGDVPPFPV
jgi:hypothetical protein